MLKVALYIRVSKTKEDGVSAETQRERGLAWCASHDAETVREYVDLDESASKTERANYRPAFQELLADARTGLFDTLLVYDLDRFGREAAEILFNTGILKALGIRLESVRGDIDYDDESGEFALVVKAGVAQLEARRIGRRTREAKETAFAREGRWTGGPVPYGYLWDREKKKLTPDPKRAPAVAHMFQMAASGDGWVRIARWLQENGHAPARSGRAWGATSIYHILKSPVYCGHTILNGAVKRNVHQPITDEATWRRAQAVMAANRVPRGPYTKWVFGRRVFCSVCGSPYELRTQGRMAGGGRKQYLSCPRRGLGGGCQNPHIMYRDFEAAFASRMAALASDETYFAAIARAMEDEARGRDLDLERATLANRLRHVMGEIDRLVEMRMRDVIPLDLYERKYREAKAEEARLLTAADELADVEAARARSRSEVAAVRRHLGAFARWGELTAGEKRELVEAVLRRATVYLDRVEIELSLPVTRQVITLRPSSYTKRGGLRFLR